MSDPAPDLPMLMPMAEIIDRLAICLLKRYAGVLNVDKEVTTLESAWVSHPYHKGGPKPFTGQLMRLIIHNAMIWSLESDVRAGREKELGLEEVGRRAIRIREHNARRTAVKAEIAQLCGEHAELKTDHASAP